MLKATGRPVGSRCAAGPPSPPDGGRKSVPIPDGCLICGVTARSMSAVEVARAGGRQRAAEQVWTPRQVFPTALGGRRSPRLFSGHLCVDCAEATAVVGSIGPTSLYRALVATLRSSRTDLRSSVGGVDHVHPGFEADVDLLPRRLHVEMADRARPPRAAEARRPQGWCIGMRTRWCRCWSRPSWPPCCAADLRGLLNGHRVLAEPVQPAGADRPRGGLLDLRHPATGRWRRTSIPRSVGMTSLDRPSAGLGRRTTQPWVSRCSTSSAMACLVICARSASWLTVVPVSSRYSKTALGPAGSPMSPFGQPHRHQVVANGSRSGVARDRFRDEGRPEDRGVPVQPVVARSLFGVGRHTSTGHGAECCTRRRCCRAGSSG